MSSHAVTRPLTTLAGLTATLLAAPAMADKVTIEVLQAFPGHAHFHEAVAKEFMAQNPDIEVRFRIGNGSYDETHQVMLRAAMTNRMPDVYHSGYHLLPEVVTHLAEKGKVIPLDSYIAAEASDFVEKNYAPSLFSQWQVDGTTWGIGFNASTPIFFVNGDLVRKAGGDPDALPDSWDGLIDLAGRISALEGDADGMAFDIHSWPDDWLWRALIIEQGAKIMAEDGQTVAFGDTPGVKALTLAKRMVDEGGMALRDYEQSRQQFAAGQIGFIMASPNSNRSFADLVGDKFELRTTTYPVSNKETGRIPTGGNAMMITAQDKAKQDAAWKYIKFASGPKGQEIAVLGSGYKPTNIAALAPDLLGKFYAENPNFNTTNLQIDRAAAWEGYPGTNGVEIWRAQRKIIGEVMTGAQSVEAGLAAMVETTNRLIAK